MPYRALLRHVNGPFSPRTSGNTFSSGQNTSSITISPVMLVRSPTLPWIAGAVRPFQPFSSTNPRITSASSFAHTTKTSAIGLFVIHDLVPVRLKPPSTLRARVVMLPGSEPALGSVSPKQPIQAPVASFGRYFCFCASVPNSLIGTMTSDPWTLIIERNPESMRSTSRATRP